MTVSNAALMKAMEAHGEAMRREIREGFDRLVAAIQGPQSSTIIGEQGGAITTEDGAHIAAARKEA